jgi:hypothetical protein
MVANFLLVKLLRDNWELIGWVSLIIGLWIACGFLSLLLFRFAPSDDDDR